MKDSLVVGVQGASRHTVTKAMSPPHLPRVVLSTPAMIQLMENVSAGLVQAHLDGHESTVGVHVCVSHVAGSLVGEEVIVRTELRTIERDRFLTFDVSAHVGDRLLGEGTHQRAVIDVTRLRRPSA